MFLDSIASADKPERQPELLQEPGGDENYRGRGDADGADAEGCQCDRQSYKAEVPSRGGGHAGLPVYSSATKGRDVSVKVV